MATTTREDPRVDSTASVGSVQPAAPHEQVHETHDAGRRFSYRVRRATRGRDDDAPVLLLGGAFQDMRSWVGLERHLGPTTTTIAIDLPGTGPADVLPAREGLEPLARCVEHVLGELGVARVAVVAASYGTPVALRFACRSPGAVHRLVLAGTMARVPLHARLRMERGLTLLAAGCLEEFADDTVATLSTSRPEALVPKAAAIRRVLRRRLARLSEAERIRFRENTRRLLRSGGLALDGLPDVPTLVFTGEHDDFTPPREGLAVARHFPRATFATIARADHLFHLQCPDATHELVRRFLRGEPLEDAPAGAWQLHDLGRGRPRRPTRTGGRASPAGGSRPASTVAARALVGASERTARRLAAPASPC